MLSSTLIKTIISILIIMFISPFTPWWSFSIITFIIGTTIVKIKETLKVCFTIRALAWLIQLVYLYFNEGQIIFTKISLLLNLNNVLILIVISSLISGLIGMLTSYIGYQINKK